jgi:hypothetical protein
VNVVDSSGWLEYFADTPNAKFFAKPIIDTERLVVPTISLLEVFKRVLQQRGENAALRVVAHMRQGRVVPLDSETALLAAKLGAGHYPRSWASARCSRCDMVGALCDRCTSIVSTVRVISYNPTRSGA